MIKNICISLFFLLESIVLNAQGVPNILWQKVYGGSSDDFCNALQKTRDGGLTMAGSTSSFNGNVQGNHSILIDDFWILHTDNMGNIQWKKCFGGSSFDRAQAIRQTADDGYIIAGTTSSDDGDVPQGTHGVNDYDCWVVKLDNAGNIEWQKTFGGSDYDIINAVEQTPDGGYILAGYSSSTDGDIVGSHGGTDCWILKLNSSGNVQWKKCIGGTGNDFAQSVVTSADGGYIIAGYTQSTNGDIIGNHGGESDGLVVKLNAMGSIEWLKCYGGSDLDRVDCVRSIGNEGYILAARSGSFDGDLSSVSNGLTDAWVIKINTSGNILWEKRYGGNNEDNFSSVDQTSDGGYIVAGATFSTDGDFAGNHGHSDFLVIKLNSMGVFEWQKIMGGYNLDFAKAIVQTNDNNFVVAGSNSSGAGDVASSLGANDYWMVKLSFSNLPVKLVSFSASVQNKSTLLTWQTSSEINSSLFVIERSENGINFEAIGSKTAAGNSQTAKSYSNVDFTPKKGINYYRLKEVDKDGNFDYSNIITVKITGDLHSRLYPNPVVSTLTILSTDKLQAIEVINEEGRVVQCFQPSVTNQYDIRTVPRGVYFLRLKYPLLSEMLKFTKQ